jgi:Ca2+-binding RTX toxin-like protein
MVDHNGTPGNDTLIGGALNDEMFGFGGNDSLVGAASTDILDGGAGNDTLSGGVENDLLIGGAGNDRLIGGTGQDEMRGGTGNDEYGVQEANDIVIELAGGGTDSILSDVGNLSLANYDNVEVLSLTNAAGAANISGSGRSDQLNGNGFINALTGGGGNDTLDGGGNNDVMKGGAGNDFYYISDADDEVIEAAGKGKDTVYASASYALAAGQEIEVLSLQGIASLSGTGNALANTIIGNIGDNVLNGLGGNDTMTGGKGNDIYVVDTVGDKLTELANQGTSDWVYSFLADYTLGANVENLFLLSGGVDGTGNTLNNIMDGNAQSNTLEGGGGNDDLSGSGGADSLVGGAGNDTMDGGSGIDTMTGGTGNDTYVVHELADKVVELAGGGTDLVRTIVDGVVLAANVENLTLQGAAIHGSGNVLANYITGNGIGNSLAGLDGNDTIDGAGGADNLSGGKGSDTYYVDDLNDKVNESAGQGKDTIFASTTFQIDGDAEIEILTLTGSGDIGGTGNKLANTINGNSGDNGIVAQDGNDTLNGGDGDDQLNGGDDVDVMNGGKGDDTYYVDDAKDKAVEAAGQGYDKVYVSAASYILGANIEEGWLSGGGAKLVGNTLANYLDGNSGANTLDGGGGNDEIDGGSGDDSLLGGAGNDTLKGSFGDDTMNGGAGNDVFEVDSLLDKIQEAAGGGTDTVRANVSAVILADNVENLILVGGSDFSGFGNKLSNVLTGNSGTNFLSADIGNDTLDGGEGGDSLVGGAGNDTYFVDDLADDVVETVGGGKDTVNSSVTFSFNDTLEIEVLNLKSASAIGSIANNFANLITMTGAGAATILGAGGNDTITGGIGNDLLFGGNDKDKLTGGDGDDTLNGGNGVDTMIGGKGHDDYEVSDVGDIVTEAAGQGNDEVLSKIANYTLTANVEELTLGTGALNGTGNTLDNTIDGNSSGNKLDGGIGNDLLRGFNGADSLTGGTGHDWMEGGNGVDTLRGGAGTDLLDGGLGSDVLYGDADLDYFLFRAEAADLALIGNDLVHGFQTGKDKIELSVLLDEFAVPDASAFSGGYVLLTKDGADTLVQFDKDGFGGSAAVTVATVVNASVATSDLYVSEYVVS